MHRHVDSRAAVQRPEVGHDTGCGPAHPGVSDAQGSLIAEIGGTATVGDSPAAAGFIDNFVQNRGHISIAMGDATFLASAYSAEPGHALAAASTFLDIWGADIIFRYESAQSTQGLHDASAASELDYFAIDFRGWSPPDGPIAIQLQQPFITRSSHSRTKSPTALCRRIRRYRGAWRQRLGRHLYQCAGHRKPLLVRECGRNRGTLAAPTRR
jgi:hypothetical protein